MFFNTVGPSGNSEYNRFFKLANHFASGLSVCQFSMDGKLEILFISQTLAEIYETDIATLQPLLEKDLLHGIVEEDRHLIQNIVGEAKVRHKDFSTSYRFITEKGNLRWMKSRASFVCTADGIWQIFSSFTDDTEFKALNHILDATLTNTKISIWEYNYENRCIIQHVNSAPNHGFEKIVPNVPESLIESGFVHPSCASDYRRMFEDLRSGDPFVEGVFKVQTPDRSGYWYEHIRYTNSFDQNGKPIAALAVSTDETSKHDIIEKYQREIEKERFFAREKGLISHALIDLTGRQTLEFVFHHGTEAGIFEEENLFDFEMSSNYLVDEKERKDFLYLNNPEILLERFQKGETEFSQDYRRKMNDNSSIWVRQTMRLIKDPYNDHVMLYAYLFNIEKEKMTELLNQSLILANYDFVAVVDANSHHFTCFRNSDVDFHMPPESGDDVDAATALLYSEAVYPEDAEMVKHSSRLETTVEYLEKQNRYIFSFRIRKPDGSTRYKKIIHYYLDKPRGKIAVLREDITFLMEQQETQKQELMEALDVAHQANQAKSQFLSRVSHELRTPLNAIIGFMDLARSSKPEEITTYLANSDFAAKQLLSIINDVLDMSSIESGKMKIAKTAFDFSHLIQSVTDLFLPICKQKGLEYDTKILTPVNEWLVGDQLRLNQILLNLLNNAVKFTSMGKIVLQINQKPLDANNVSIHFDVIDTGCGMSPEFIGRLFKPFEQESSAVAQKHGGTGLGLSIVYNLVKLMHGTISVDSHIGIGTKFSFELTFPKSQAVTDVGMLPSAGSVHVLVIDDQESDRSYMSSVLNHLGIRHTCVSGSRNFFEELERGDKASDPYNVCIVDWKMPDENGLAITRHIRTSLGNRVMVIMVSAYDHYQADESVKSAGADYFISKPVFQSKLFDIFSNMTSGNMSPDSAVPQTYDLSDMHLLVAEDNAMNRTMMSGILKRKFGIVSDFANDGKIALDRFLASKEGEIDAILMDIQMPNMDGYEAAKTIRSSSHPDANKIQIIAVTADAFSEDVTKSLSCGMNAHVSKPIDTHKLGLALAKAYLCRRDKPAPMIAASERL